MSTHKITFSAKKSKENAHLSSSAVMNNSPYVLLSYSDGSIESLIMSATGIISASTTSVPGQITSIHSTQKKAVAATSSGVVYTWDYIDGNLENRSEFPVQTQPISHVQCLNSNLFLVVFSSGTMAMCDTAGTVVHNFHAYENTVQKLLTDGQVIVTLSQGQIKFWEFVQDQNTVGVTWLFS